MDSQATPAPSARMRRTSSATRVAVSALVGVLVGAAVAVWQPWQGSILAGWSAAALSLLSYVWVSVGRLDPDETRRLARHVDDSRAAADITLLSASVVCLVGVGLDLVKAAGEHGADKAALVALGVLSVLLAWAAVHTVYVLHYARLYYGDPEGGIDFQGGGDPDYGDFAYLAFTVGMTYQVSDTDLKAKAIRRAVLRHALLSYLFGTVIVAITINVVAGLLK